MTTTTPLLVEYISPTTEESNAWFVKSLNQVLENLSAYVIT
jgi:hypothetical protein